MIIHWLSATSALPSIPANLFAQAQQNPSNRIPLWLWILIGLIVIAIGVIWTLWEEGELKKKQAQPALASEPGKQAAAAPMTRSLITEAKPTPSTPQDQDDLTRINGIGPKIARTLNDHGIFTFEQLAATEVSFLEALMMEREWHMADPNTWPAQAQALSEEKHQRRKKLE
jgi:predicted flap endonuclease-1-like 5' DNA nuclease